MTKDDTKCSVTTDYISTHNFATWDEILGAKEELLDKINAEFDAHNVVAGKGKKWTYPETLPGEIVSMLAVAAFKIRRIKCCESSSPDISYETGIYVDEMSLKVLGDEYKEYYGTYVAATDALDKVIRFFNHELKPSEIKAIRLLLGQDAPKVTRCFNKDYIPVNNGIFNYETKQLMDFSSDIVFLSKFAVNYNPNASNKVFTNPDGTLWSFDDWIPSLTDDPEIVPFLDTYILSCLVRSNVSFGRCFVLTGEQGCGGKGSLLTLWRSVLGERAYVSKQLTDFSEKFALEDLVSAQAIITDENDTDGYIKKASRLKAVITNDKLSIERKFKSPVTCTFKGTMVTCTNKRNLRVADTSDSFYRRFIFLPMTKCFTNSENKLIKSVYLHDVDVLEYALKKALESNFYALPIPQCSLDSVEESKDLNNPVYSFWYELRDSFKWNLLPFGFLYSLYKVWFKRNVPSGIVSKKSSFKQELREVIMTDDEWQWRCDGNDNVKTGKLMEGPEYLILEYGLTDWMCPKYAGTNKDILCIPQKSATYQGILRVGASIQVDDDSDEQED